jgi:hypothetical protein
VYTIIPDGIELIKISISAPGVVHCSDNKNTNRNLIEIIKSIPSLLNENLYLDEKLYDNTLNNLVKRISFYVEKYSVSPIIEEKRSGHLFNIYKEHYSKGFKIHKLLPGQKIANKKYWRYYGDKNKNEFILAKMDNKLDVHKISENKYKIPKLPDLFEAFYPEETTYPENDYQVVNLDQILKYYVEHGISHLILFDFSCSVFENAIFYYTSGPGIQEVVEQNKDIPSGGKFNKKSYKRKTYKKTCKRKFYKKKTHKRKTCKRKLYKK